MCSTIAAQGESISVYHYSSKLRLFVLPLQHQYDSMCSSIAAQGESTSVYHYSSKLRVFVLPLEQRCQSICSSIAAQGESIYYSNAQQKAEDVYHTTVAAR